MARPRKEKKSQLPKGVSEQFVDSIQSMQTDELKAQVVLLQVQNAENEEFKASQAFIQAKSEFDYAKQTFDQVAGPVKETTVSMKNRTKMVIERLREKGAI